MSCLVRVKQLRGSEAIRRASDAWLAGGRASTSWEESAPRGNGIILFTSRLLYGPEGFCAPRLCEKELASGRAMPIVFYYQRPPSKTASQNTDATLRQHTQTVHAIRLGSTCKDRVNHQAVDLSFTIFASHHFRRMGNGKELKKAS